jgi:hypothetical protein
MPLARRIATTAIGRPIGVSRSGRADTAAGADNQVPERRVGPTSPHKLPSVPRQILKDIPRPPNSASRDD